MKGFEFQYHIQQSNSGIKKHKVLILLQFGFSILEQSNRIPRKGKLRTAINTTTTKLNCLFLIFKGRKTCRDSRQQEEMVSKRMDGLAIDICNQSPWYRSAQCLK